VAEGTVQSIEIDAEPAACFAVAADVAAYPEWATGVRSTEVLETDDQGRPHRAAFVIDGMVKEIAYTLTYSYDEPNSMSWSADPGDDLKALDGSYTFKELDEGRTEIVYALRAEPAFIIPGFLRRQVEKQIVGTALRGLRERVGAVAGG
jgi:ribosome-associated toxin RatA of RatAB toxin-antitoxin module